MVQFFAQAAQDTLTTVAMIFTIILIVLGLIAIIFSVWMLVDAAIKPVNNKVLWIILILFVGPLAALIYFFTDRKKLVDPSTAAPAHNWEPNNGQGNTTAVPTTSPIANTEQPKTTDAPADKSSNDGSSTSGSNGNQ